jgi:uncharacterized protein YjeT (DUF2065 family)
MGLNPNAPILIVTVVAICQGGYLILRPAEYKAAVRTLSRSPSWSIRILGLFLIVLALVITYLALKEGAVR